ncbi:MAG: choice-of-anchor Q domain-containing protein, partial [Anaerolineae bacterium]
MRTNSRGKRIASFVSRMVISGSMVRGLQAIGTCVSAATGAGRAGLAESTKPPIRRVCLGTLASTLALGLLALILGFLSPGSVRADPATYFVSTGGLDTNDCSTPSSPCRTVQAAIDKSVAGDEILVAVGRYTGTSGTVALITRSLSLEGGWNSTFTEYNPTANPTILDAERAGPVIVLRGPLTVPAITPTIEGFVITRGDGTGVSDCMASPFGGCGGGVFGTNTIPQIVDSVITNNIATISGVGFGGGVHLQGGLSGALISGTSILSNAAAFSPTTAISGFGGGVSLHNVTATLQGNVISGNLAATGEGYGGGVHLYRSGGWLYTNTIHHNVASSAGLATNLGFGGGVCLWQSLPPHAAPPTLESNDFHGNVASQGGAGAGGAVGLLNAGVLITDNLIISNTAALDSGQVGNGGGIFGNDGSVWNIINNRIVGNVAATQGRGFGGGLQLQNAQINVVGNLVADNVTTLAATDTSARGGGMNLLGCSGSVRHNTIRGNVTGLFSTIEGWGGGISIVDTPVALESNVIVGNTATRWGGGVRILRASWVTMTNNVIGRNTAQAHGGGVHVLGEATAPASALLIHNTVANNADGLGAEGVYASGASEVTMVNNIVVSHEVGIGTAGPSSTIMADYTLFSGNSGSDTSGAVTSTNPLLGAPVFLDPTNDDYHLALRSRAINAGVDTGLSVDIDGDARPLGLAADVGADEYRITHALELIPNQASSAIPGTDVIYVHTLTNHGTYTDTFDLSLSSSQGWSVSLSPGGPVALGAGDSSAITATVSIPSGAISGTVDTTTVTATSQGDGTTSDAAVDTTTVNAAYLAPTITPDRASTADPDETTVFTHTLSNHSNTTETFTLDAISEDSWSVSVSPNPTVPPFGSATASVSITVPSDAIAGMSDVTTLTASGTAGSDSVEDTITVGLIIGLSLAPDYTAGADPGTSVAFTHDVTNTGNFTDTFDVAAVSDQSWAVQYSPLSVTLPAHGMASVAVTLTVPADAVSGTVDTTTVTATSQGDGTTSDAAVDTTTVTAAYLVPTITPERATTADPEETVVFT